jgi:hypothetical protein
MKLLNIIPTSILIKYVNISDTRYGFYLLRKLNCVLINLNKYKNDNDEIYHLALLVKFSGQV